VADREAADRPVGGLPARPGLPEADRVEAHAADLHEGVTGVGEDRHPPAGPGLAPARERARVERALEQAGRGEREGHRAAAVVGRVDPDALGALAPVAAAVDVGQPRDLVGRGDDPLDGERRVGRGGRVAAAERDGAAQAVARGPAGVGGALAVELLELGADLIVAGRAGRDLAARRVGGRGVGGRGPGRPIVGRRGLALLTPRRRIELQGVRRRPVGPRDVRVGRQRPGREALRARLIGAGVALLSAAAGEQAREREAREGASPARAPARGDGP
jgi:hypothetical protein